MLTNEALGNLPLTEQLHSWPAEWKDIVRRYHELPSAIVCTPAKLTTARKYQHKQQLDHPKEEDEQGEFLVFMNRVGSLKSFWNSVVTFSVD